MEFSLPFARPSHRSQRRACTARGLSAQYTSQRSAGWTRKLLYESLECRYALDSTVVFSELMYHPRESDASPVAIPDTESLEWIELHNLMSVDMDLSRWSIRGIDYTFDSNTIMPAGAYWVIAKDPLALKAATGYDATHGPYAGQLANGGETLELINNNDRVMDRLDYGDTTPWPLGADGSGASLAKRHKDLASSEPASWLASRLWGGTPGVVNEALDALVPSATSVSLHEVSATADISFRLELFNGGTEAVNLAAHSLRSSDPTHATVPLSGILGAGQYVSLNTTSLGYRPAAGERLFLLDSLGHLQDAAAVDSVPRGRMQTTPDVPFMDLPWYVETQTTFGAPNSIQLESDIVINEIMYHAPGVPSTPPTPATYDVTTLLPLNGSVQWRYRDQSTGLNADWAATAHTLGTDGWKSGAAPIGFDRDPLTPPLATVLPAPATVFPPIRTYYFETEFTLTADQLATSSSLLLRHSVDDGAAFYLNGTQVASYNLPAGPWTSQTLATSTVDNAALSDLVPLEKTALLVGRNRVSVEVHQDSVSSSDVVFGLELLLGVETTPAKPGTPYRDSDEEWIELYNRSPSRTIDLSGWQVSDAVSYVFPAGTQLAPESYLVVARDPVALAAREHPSRPFLGPFSGQLSNQSETIRLLDSHGNPVGQVRYFDGGRWAAEADGGGASLELRDPRDDNRVPEAWAASALVEIPAWQTFTYRGLAQADGTTDGVTSRYQEFIFGLLDAGELLIDDLSVMELTATSAIERLQNGSFDQDALGASPAKLRIQGNHHGAVVTDPHDPTNQVLHLTATGALEDRFNHVETTFADGARIRIGSEYQISFRAIWLSGSSQLTTRLYFNRLAKTHSLSRPPRYGTPGRVNSQLSTNTGTLFTELKHAPPVPDVDAPVTVTARATDGQAVSAMALWYRVNDADWQSVAMVPAADGSFQGSIPGQAAAATVQFYVTAVDGWGVTSAFPAEAADSRALYRVQDGRAATRGLHNFRIVMTPADTTRLHQRTHQMSNDRIGATVIYDEAEVFYNVGVRLKGSNAGRSDATYLGFNVQFDPMQLFRGVHDSVAIDRSGRSSLVSSAQDEILIKHVANHAGDIPMMYDDLVHILAPNRAHNRTALLMMSRNGDEFLDSQYTDGASGTIFRLDIAYVPNNTEGNQPEGTKLPTPYSHPSPTRDLQDLGDDPELYRTHLLIRNNLAEDDYSRIIELSKAMSLTGRQQMDRVSALIDLDQWARVFALQSLTGAADTYTQGALHHNIQFYVPPEDQRILALPWDWDFAFTQPANNALIGTSSNTGRLLNQPGARRLVYGHLYDLITTTFNNEYLDPWIDHYGQVAGRSYAAIKNYVRSRQAHVLGRLPAPLPFSLNASPDGIVTDSRSVTVSGSGWIDVARVRLVDSDTALDVRWLDDERFELTLPLTPGTHDYSLSALDRYGKSVGTATVRITSNAAAAADTFLRISELNYHPADPTLTELNRMPGVDDGDFEFIELLNTGPSTVDLTRLQFTQGIDVTLADGTLSSGEAGVIVSNRTAFELRYGIKPRVLGEYAGQLDNAGESLRLQSADGRVLVEFAYQDDAPWPSLPDGGGATLQLNHPQGTAPSDSGTADFWRASLPNGGTPGLSAVGSADFNHDGRIDVGDVDLICSGLANREAAFEEFDLDSDGQLTASDVNMMLTAVVGTRPGDANLDGRFNSQDLVQIFQRGDYHDNVLRNSTWSDGDWNCDGEFTSADFVLALQAGDYE